MSEAKTATGPYTGRLYTATEVECTKPTDEKDKYGCKIWRKGSCWTYYVEREGRRYSPGVSYESDQHASAEDALARAVMLDVLSAAEGDWSELTREQYEAECARLGARARSDKDVDTYAVHFFEVDWRHGGIHEAVELTLAKRRLKPITREKEARKKIELDALRARAAALPQRRWAEGGVRYDEACDQCGKTSEVDNDTGLCQRCYGAPRTIFDY